jgi:multiple sugar transport system permease protein
MASEARDRLGLWLMATPFLVGAAVLVIGPAIGTVALALFEWDLVTHARFVGLGNVRALADDRVFAIALGNSLAYAGISVPIRVLAAVALASLLWRRRRGTGVARASVFAASVVPDVALAAAWLWILNPLYGPLNLALEAVGSPTPSWLTEPTPARWAIVLIGVFQIGEGFAIALAARRSVPRELEDTAAAAGAGPWGTYARVVLPAMGPALLLLAARDTVAGLQITLVPALVVTDGGPPPYATTYLPVFIYREAFEYLRFGTAAAATVVLLLVTAAALWLQYVALARMHIWMPWRDDERPGAGAARVSGGRGRAA